MPRIDAPTVAEHHQRRRADLIEAAIAVLASGGVDAVSLASVGARAGLARSSVYQYFDSSAALLAAVVEESLPEATAQLAAAVDRATGPMGRVDAYLRAYLRAATDDRHRSLAALGTAPLPPECLARLQELHDQQAAPLRAALAELDLPDPDLSTQIILGVLRAGSAAVGRGVPLARVVRETLRFTHDGLVPASGGERPQ